VEKSGVSVGAETARKIKDLSWIEPLVQWSTTKFRKDWKIGFSPEFIVAFRDI